MKGFDEKKLRRAITLEIVEEHAGRWVIDNLAGQCFLIEHADLCESLGRDVEFREATEVDDNTWAYLVGMNTDFERFMDECYDSYESPETYREEALELFDLMPLEVEIF